MLPLASGGVVPWCGLLPLEERTLLTAAPLLVSAAEAHTIDLAVTQVTSTLLSTAVPGDRAQMRATLTNMGSSTLNTTLPLLVLVIDDEGGQTTVATVNAKLSLKPGKSKTISIPVTVSTQWPQSHVTLRVSFDGSLLADENAANDQVVDADLYDIRYEFGKVAGRASMAKFTFTQDEQVITFSLSGSEGLGQVELDDAGLATIDLSGTTLRSSVRITTKGGDRIARLAGVTIQGDLNAFDAKSTDLQGDFDISGQLRKLTLRDVTQGDIDIRGTAFSNQRVNLTLAQVQDVSLQSAMAIGTFKVSQWLDADDDDLIAAPSISSMSIAGDFEASVRLSDTTSKQTLGSLSIGGTASEVTLRASGHIGKIKAGRLFDVVILSGIEEATEIFPPALHEFERDTTIASLTVSGLRGDPTAAGVVNTYIAASRLGSLKLTNIDRSSAAAHHGIAADTIDRFTGSFADSSGSFSFSRLDDQSTFDTQSASVDWGAFAITLLELPQFAPPVLLDVMPVAETTPVPSSGDAADDIAIWVDPVDSSQSLIIGSNKAGGKNGGLFIYDLAGNVVSAAAQGQSMNNVDLRYGMIHNGVAVDVVAATNRSQNTIDLFIIDPINRSLIAAGSISLDEPNLESFGEAYGLAMHHDQGSDRYFVFASDKSGRIAQFELVSSETGIIGELVRYWKEQSVVEGMVSDDLTGLLYVGEETKGIYRYQAVPDSVTASAIAGPPPADRLLVDDMKGPLDADVEGLAIYRASAEHAYLIASSQGSNRYVIYDASTFQRLAVIRIIASADGLIDGTSDTDGIEAVAGAFGPEFEMGLFIVQDGSNTGGQNYKMISWADVMQAAGAQGLTLFGNDSFDQ